MKTPRWFAFCLASAFGLALNSSATVLVDDTWADGNRTNTSLPTDSAWFASSASSLTNYAPGSMTGLCDPANSRTWLTYFTTTPATPVDLSVGETLKVTLVFIPTDVADFAGGIQRGLRVGLFNFADGGTRAAADSSFVGSTTGSGTNVTGYLLNQSFYITFPVDGPMEFWVRNNVSSGNLMGTTANYQQVGASGPAGHMSAPGFVSGTQYTLELSATRTATSSMEVSTRITGGSLNLFHTVTDTSYSSHRFDCVAIRCANATNTATSFTFNEFKVELISPAAPSVTTLPATNVINDVAALNGTVTPHDLPTTAWFEWGTVPFYRQQTAPVSVGAGLAAVLLSNTLTGLTAGVLYHYRAVASNSFGVVRGGEIRFWAPKVIVIGSNPVTNECHTPLSQTAANRFAVGSAYASIAAGLGHSLALRADGTVVGWGNSSYGQTTIPSSATNVVAIAAGSFHNLALRADGTVVGWGANDYGQTNIPASATNVVAIAAGRDHSLALRDDGTVVGWGNNYSGQTNIPSSATNVVAIAAGDYHSLALRADGTVVGWGANNYGQTNIPPSATNVVAIAAGFGHSLALRADGTVVGWGANAEGQITIPESVNNVVAIAAGTFHNLALRADGTVVGWGWNGAGQTYISPSATNVVAIAAGWSYSLALRADGTVIGWGANAEGQITIPESVNNVVAIAAGYYHSLALRTDGTVVGWGANDYGQTNIPPSATNVVAIAAGGYHSLALRADGTVDGWGDNNRGQTTIRAGETIVVAIAAGEYHSLALYADGTVDGWGENDGGQTTIPASATNVVAIAAGGNQSLALRADGTVVGWGDNRTIPAGVTNVVAIAAGEYHSLALRADGTVVGWGDNEYGQITIPAGATNVVAIAAGSEHSLALRADGTVVGCGWNAEGQITIPDSVTNVVAIAAGGYHSLALRADDTILGWGWNVYGQATPPVWLANLGLSTATSGTVDSDVPGLYAIVFSATNTTGGVGVATRSVWVVDTIPPTLSLVGANPLLQPRGTPFVDPGATATDVCAGDLTGSILVSGTVSTNVLGYYTLTYTVTDSSGNSATNNRTVVVAAAPSVSSSSATPVGTNAAGGSPQARFSANINPNGLPSQAFFDYGLSTAYPGRTAQTNLPAGFTDANVAVNSSGLVPGVTYHWRAVATNELGATCSADQIFTAPLVFAAGDVNGDGIVDQGELNQVLSNYSATSPWLYLTNVAGLGGTNVTFALSNSTEGAYSVLRSTNLVDWDYLGPATPRYEFTDTNAPVLPRRYYRLRWP